jgi:hypothetical protein
MNKYLEKIAQLNPIIVGGAIGAGLGSLAGLRKNRAHRINTKNKYEEERLFTKKERIINSVMGATIAGIYGVAVGGKVKLERDWAKASKGKAGSGGPVYGNLQKHFEDMGGKGFKTKEQAHRHFKTMASKWHPDKPGGNTAKMQKLNDAWTKAKAHPDFEKMSQLNKYIGVLNHGK